MAACFVILAPGFEEIEALSVVNILRRGGVKTTIAGLSKEKIAGRCDIQVLPDTDLHSISLKDYDMVILPGGLGGVDNMLKSKLCLDLILTMDKESKYIAAICAAPKILARLDIIHDKCVTSYPSEKDGIIKKAKQYSDKKVVIDKNIITSRGPGTAIDFSLTLLEVLMGEGVRRDVQTKIQYCPQ